VKLRILFISVLALVTLAVAACATASGAPLPPTSYAIQQEQFVQQKDIQQDVAINAGEFFTISLPSNASTGFAWAGLVPSGSPVEQIDHKYLEGQAMPGAAGQEVWTFKALKAGTTTIKLEYSRPWEGGEKAVRTLTINVTVK
jgi:inhibitor of cysteine peptidase